MKLVSKRQEIASGKLLKLTALISVVLSIKLTVPRSRNILTVTVQFWYPHVLKLLSNSKHARRNDGADNKRMKLLINL